MEEINVKLFLEPRKDTLCFVQDRKKSETSEYSASNNDLPIYSSLQSQSISTLQTQLLLANLPQLPVISNLIEKGGEIKLLDLTQGYK